MKTDENRKAMERIVEMFATGALSDVESVISRDYIDHQGLRGLTIRGPVGFSQVVATARKGWPNLRIVIEDMIAEDDKVVTRLRWYNIDPSGKKIERETIDILRFSNGQAVEHWGAVSRASEDSSGDQSSP